MTNLMQVTENAVVSMTSLEIVEFINSRRPEGSAELRHDSFMTKVPKVLGEKDLQNFLEIYSDSYGREQRCYRLLSFQQMVLRPTTYRYEQICSHLFGSQNPKNRL